MARDTYHPGKHVPKVVRCNAGRDEAALYKNLGNSNRIKFMWVEEVTISGTSQLIYDAGDFGAGQTVTKPDHYVPGAAAYGKTIADLYFWPVAMDAPAGSLYIDVDTVADTVTLKSTAGETNLPVNVLVFSN
jgi:hypothetical protein